MQYFTGQKKRGQKIFSFLEGNLFIFLEGNLRHPCVTHFGEAFVLLPVVFEVPDHVGEVEQRPTRLCRLISVCLMGALDVRWV